MVVVSSRMRRVTASSMLMLVALTGLARAADFDEKLKTPMMKDAGSLRTQVDGYSARFAALGDAGAEKIVASPTLAAERFDLVWQIQQAIDVHRPLGDLAAIGITPRKDGSFNIDVVNFPQWDNLDQRLPQLLPQMNWPLFTQLLVDRGMTPDDTVKLRHYVEDHPIQATLGPNLLPVSLSFANLVRKYDKLKQPVPDSLVLAYVYQRARVADETNRAWSAALFASLQRQGARVLVSALNEGTHITLWGPSDQAAGLADILATVRSPDFDAKVTAESKAVITTGAKP